MFVYVVLAMRVRIHEERREEEGRISIIRDWLRFPSHFHFHRSFFINIVYKSIEHTEHSTVNSQIVLLIQFFVDFCQSPGWLEAASLFLFQIRTTVGVGLSILFWFYFRNRQNNLAFIWTLSPRREIECIVNTAFLFQQYNNN